ncbi:MAG: tyrosine-protein kinase Etk/Wzc, partial [Limisphaerales bacterium]
MNELERAQAKMNNEGRLFKSPVEMLFGEDFNLGLFLHITRQNLIWLVLFVVLFFSLVTIFLRYQVPVHQASSYLLLKKNESPNLIDIEVLLKSDDPEAINQEIEIIRSPQFVNNALSELPLGISFFTKGNILTSGFYKNEPFSFSYDILDSIMIGRSVNFNVVDENYYTISYNSIEGLYEEKLQFGHIYNTPLFNIQIDPVREFNPGWLNVDFFFTFNDRDKQNRKIANNLTIAIADFRSNKIAIHMRDYLPTKAIDIVNAMADAIIDYEYRTKATSASLVIGFLDKQIDTLKQELFEQENELRLF